MFAIMTGIARQMWVNWLESLYRAYAIFRDFHAISIYQKRRTVGTRNLLDLQIEYIFRVPVFGIDASYSDT